MGGKVSCLRGLLRFLYLEGYVSIPLADALPKIQNVYRTTVPTVWKLEELQKIKQSIDIGNPTGKRDYAIIMLVASTGLCGGDIISLRLSDINWDKKEISITQSKTSSPLILPLMDDAGWAIIEYIRNGRPESQMANMCWFFS